MQREVLLLANSRPVCSAAQRGITNDPNLAESKRLALSS
jgi:hypothetical protein